MDFLKILPVFSLLFSSHQAHSAGKVRMHLGGPVYKVVSTLLGNDKFKLVNGEKFCPKEILIEGSPNGSGKLALEVQVFDNQQLFPGRYGYFRVGDAPKISNQWKIGNDNTYYYEDTFGNFVGRTGDYQLGDNYFNAKVVSKADYSVDYPDWSHEKQFNYIHEKINLEIRPLTYLAQPGKALLEKGEREILVKVIDNSDDVQFYYKMKTFNADSALNGTNIEMNCRYTLDRK